MRAIRAVLQRLTTSAFVCDRDAWEHFGASERSFKTYKSKLRLLEDRLNECSNIASEFSQDSAARFDPDDFFSTDDQTLSEAAPPPVTVPQEHAPSLPAPLASPPFFVAAETVQSAVMAGPVADALDEHAREAVEAGDEFDAEAKLAQLSLGQPPRKDAGESSTSRASPSQLAEQAKAHAHMLHADEIDAKAAIEEDAGLVTTPITDSLTASKQNCAYKDELRRFWIVHGVAFTSWWKGLSQQLRRQVT